MSLHCICAICEHYMAKVDRIALNPSSFTPHWLAIFNIGPNPNMNMKL